MKRAKEGSGIVDPREVAEAWEGWCGETPWSVGLKQFASLGGKIKWWCGMPRSASAIPLCFVLYDSEEKELEVGNERLKDINKAIEILINRKD